MWSRKMPIYKRRPWNWHLNLPNATCFLFSRCCFSFSFSMTASTLCTKWKINPPHHNHSLSPKRTHAHTHSVIYSYMNLFTFFNDCHKYPPHDPTYPIISIHLVKTNTPILTHTLAHSAVQNSSYSLLCCLRKIINNPTFASTYQYTNVHTSMYVCM